MVKRQKFTSEFKREALRLMESSGKPAADLARELGVRRNQLYKWKEQLDRRGTQAFRGAGTRPEISDEVGRLKGSWRRSKRSEIS